MRSKLNNKEQIINAFIYIFLHMNYDVKYNLCHLEVFCMCD